MASATEDLANDFGEPTRAHHYRSRVSPAGFYDCIDFAARPAGGEFSYEPRFPCESQPCGGSCRLPARHLRRALAQGPGDSHWAPR
jgi:hypothetical protein